MEDTDLIYFMKKRMIYENMSKALYLDVREGVEKLRNGLFAFYCEAPVCYDIISNTFQSYEICDLKEIDSGNKFKAGLILSKYSPMREIVSRNILRLYENGIFKKHKMFWYGTKPHCRQNDFITSVGYEYVGPLFFSLFVAYITAILILILELISMAMSRRRKICNRKHI